MSVELTEEDIAKVKEFADRLGPDAGAIRFGYHKAYGADDVGAFAEVLDNYCVAICKQYDALQTINAAGTREGLNDE